MSWDYDPTHKVARDWVRWRIGDTDRTDQLLTNEEIDAAIATEGNRYLAAALSADSIAAKFARKVDQRVGPLAISASQKAEAYRKLAKRLRTEIATRVAPYASGISQDDIRTVESDTDRVPADFAVGFQDTPGTRSAAEDERLGDV